MSDNVEFFEEDDYVSKTQIKREKEASRAVGLQLIELNDKQLEAADLPDELKRAVIAAKKIKSHLARKRQAQYIGKLMKKFDEAQVQAVLDRAHHTGSAVALEMKHLNHWRDRLLDEGKPALTDYLNEFPQVEVQQLRHLIRAAQQEREKQNGSGAGKKLFRFLREQLG